MKLPKVCAKILKYVLQNRQEEKNSSSNSLPAQKIQICLFQQSS